MNTRGVVMGFLRSGSIPQRSVAYRANDRLRLAGRLEYCPGRHPWRVTQIHIYCQVALLGRATVRLFRGRNWILGVCLVGRCRPSSITTGAGGGKRSRLGQYYSNADQQWIGTKSIQESRNVRKEKAEA